MTLEEVTARMNAQVQEDLPGYPEVVCFEAPDASPARMMGMDFTREANSTPLGDWPAVDARGKIAIAVQRGFIPSDHVWLHEAVGHGSEEWLYRRGFKMYPPERLDDGGLFFLDETTVQERLWRAYHCDGNYGDHIRQTGGRMNDAREWWAEMMGTLYDRTREPFNATAIASLFGGNPPIPGLYVWRHW